jgi:hypothetical protein
MREDCDKQCAEIASERIRYFTGRYMTARDFRDEQRYHQTHRYLHNRILHGWGVVCGLHVNPHPVEICRKDHVKVDCGMALDCCGHEILVRKPVVPPPIPWDQKPADHAPEPPQPAGGGRGTGAPGDGRDAPANPTAARDSLAGADAESVVKDPRRYPLLCLEYCESEIECVPMLYNEHNCDEQRREFSRVAESYRFAWHWVRYSELPKYRWKITGGACPEGTPATYDPVASPPSPSPCPDDDCYDEDDLGKSAPCCLDPQCPPDHCVALAWIRVEPGALITVDSILTMGRPTLESPLYSLTHICGINWPHGGIIARRHLEEHLKRLEIRFDRRLKKAQQENDLSGPRGVNPATFIVQFGGGYEDLDFVTYTDPPHVEHDCIAVFTIDPRSRERHHERPYAYLENQTVYITLKCDFILDCHDVPVDGDHLGGLLPSGDGVRGGTFESWFYVVPDHEWDRQQQERP